MSTTTGDEELALGCVTDAFYAAVDEVSARNARSAVSQSSTSWPS
jgi:hypothetical protein